MDDTAQLSLPAGVTLMVATGFVDAYTFVQHGHVFAEAMTGNLVLTAVGSVDPTIVRFWQPLATYAAFVVGVVAAWWWTRAAGRAARVSVISVQVAALAVIGFLPSAVPPTLITCAVAFGSGLQIAAFRHIGATKFTTTVMTSNSLRVIGASMAAWVSRSADDIATARSGLVAFAGFVCGIFAGAGLSDLLGDRAAWVDAGLFALVGLMYGWTSRDAARPEKEIAA